MEWDVISFIMAGKVRFKVLIELKNAQKTPSELKKTLNVPISHISKTLKELENKELVECLTPERRKTKFYIITEKGEKTLGEISKITRNRE